jgi:hypothetical protein
MTTQQESFPMQQKFRLLSAVLLAGTCLAMPHAAHALNGTSNIQIDGGPLGPLDFSGGVDGYFYAQGGQTPGHNGTGADVDDFMIQLSKNTGPVQFQLQLADYAGYTLGAGYPKEANANHFTTGPLRAANVSFVVNNNLTLQVGQLGSLEGYESTFTWNNPTGVDTILYYVTNSENRGVSATYTQGPASLQVTYGDGNDTGVWNYLQFLGTYNFDSNNNLNVFGGIELGVTGPAAYGYGQTTVGGNGIYNVDCNVFGAWYSSTIGNLTLTPEVQYQYSNPLHRYASSGNDIPKYTGDFGAVLFGQYNFGTSPYSIGAWVEYATSNGAADWFINPGARLVGGSIGPAWQYKDIYTRLTGGFVHLLNTETYGNSGTSKDYGIAQLQAGLVF